MIEAGDVISCYLCKHPLWRALEPIRMGDPELVELLEPLDERMGRPQSGDAIEPCPSCGSVDSLSQSINVALRLPKRSVGSDA